MRKIMLLLAILLALPGAAGAENGLVIKQSSFSAVETLDRLQAVLEKKGLTIFTRIDHSAGAGKAGMALPPTQLLIFGNPKMGTPLMASTRSVGIDLPMKVLAWEDEDGKSWIAYNRPDYLAGRHGITDQVEIVNKMSGALDKFTNLATQAETK